jgi:hypothetical protein
MYSFSFLTKKSVPRAVYTAAIARNGAHGADLGLNFVQKDPRKRKTA